MHRPINELKCARRTTGEGGGQPVFKDEEEPELPILYTSVLSPNLGAGSGAVAEPQVKPSADRGGDGDNTLADVLGAVGQESWNEFVLPPVTWDANAAKSQVVGYQTLGLVYTDEEARRNAHTPNPQGIPNAILQTAHGKVYIPLSMLTTRALKRVRTNDNLRYTKVPNGIVKQTLDPTQFGAEDDMSSHEWHQAYSNWIQLLKILAEPKIVAG